MWAYRSDHLFFILKLIKAKIKGSLPSKSLVVIYENVEPEVDKNWNYLLRVQQTFAQDKKCSIFWRNSYPKGWKVSAWARKTRSLLASCQLRNFLHEFTGKVFCCFSPMRLTTWFISCGILCSYFSGNLLLSFLFRHDFKTLFKLSGGGTFLSLASPVNIL